MTQSLTRKGNKAVSAETESAFNIHPMDQFVVKPLFGGELAWYSVTNVTLWMGISVVAVIALLVIGTRGRAVVPSRSQSIAEIIYGFVHKMVEDIAGKEGLRYFPYIMTLFMFIVLANLLGLLPKSFTTTSHIAVTATMALAVFVFVTLLGFVKNGTPRTCILIIPRHVLILEMHESISDRCPDHEHFLISFGIQDMIHLNHV